MIDRRLIAAATRGLVRASLPAEAAPVVETVLRGTHVRCLAVDPLDRKRIYAGTLNAGVLRSDDYGRTWRSAGLAGEAVTALASSPLERNLIYAGTRPARLFVSRDGGENWRELSSFRHIPGRWFWFSPAEKPFQAYVQSIALSPTDPARIVAGIEFGATVVSGDGGMTWTGHRPGALRDCHMVVFHARDGDWVYEGGGTGGGAAFSRDAGQTWTQAGAGMDRHYGWAVAADPVEPGIWYVAVAPGPRQAHGSNAAAAYIFRREGATWQRLAGGLPQPLAFMPYALIPEPDRAGALYAVLRNGDVWHSCDYGDSWAQLPVGLGEVQRAVVLV